MPKLVTSMTAARISMLIDSVQSAAGRGRPRLMGKGKVIVGAFCEPGRGVHDQQSNSPNKILLLHCFLCPFLSTPTGVFTIR